MKTKRPISVSQMAKLAGFSRQRFYDLIKQGVFPEPMRTGSRPMYTPDLQSIVLGVTETGVGVSGEMVLFNQKSTETDVVVSSSGNASRFHSLTESLSGLGLTVSSKQVAIAVKELSITDLDLPETIRRVFLHLKN